MNNSLKSNYSDIIFYSLPKITQKIIQRRIDLLLNLKNRNEDKIYFNQEEEWKILGYSSKRVLEMDLNILERAKNVLKIYEKNLLFLIINNTSCSQLAEEYLNSFVQENNKE